MSEGNMRSMQRLENLSGAEYEIRVMQSDDPSPLARSGKRRNASTPAEHPELIELYSNIRDVQLAEISQLQAWLEPWYDRNGGPPVPRPDVL